MTYPFLRALDDNPYMLPALQGGSFASCPSITTPERVDAAWHALEMAAIAGRMPSVQYLLRELPRDRTVPQAIHLRLLNAARHAGPTMVRTVLETINPPIAPSAVATFACRQTDRQILGCAFASLRRAVPQRNTVACHNADILVCLCKAAARAPFDTAANVIAIWLSAHPDTPVQPAFEHVLQHGPLELAALLVQNHGADPSVPRPDGLTVAVERRAPAVVSTMLNDGRCNVLSACIAAKLHPHVGVLNVLIAHPSSTAKLTETMFPEIPQPETVLLLDTNSSGCVESVQIAPRLLDALLQLFAATNRPAAANQADDPLDESDTPCNRIARDEPNNPFPARQPTNTDTQRDPPDQAWRLPNGRVLIVTPRAECIKAIAFASIHKTCCARAAYPDELVSLCTQLETVDYHGLSVDVDKLEITDHTAPGPRPFKLEVKFGSHARTLRHIRWPWLTRHATVIRDNTVVVDLNFDTWCWDEPTCQLMHVVLNAAERGDVAAGLDAIRDGSDAATALLANIGTLE